MVVRDIFSWGIKFISKFWTHRVFISGKRGSGYDILRPTPHKQYKMACLNSRTWELRIEDWELRIEDWELRMEDWGLRTEDWGLRIENWGLRIEDCGYTLHTRERSSKVIWRSWPRWCLFFHTHAWCLSLESL